MKRILTAIAAVLFAGSASTPALAQTTTTYDPHLYGGVIVGVNQDAEISGSIGGTRLSADIDLDGTPFSGILGYQFNEYWAIEGRLGTYDDFCVGITGTRICTDKYNSASLLGKLGFQASEYVYPYILSGYTHSWVEIGSTDTDEGEWGWGVGAAFTLSEDWSINIEFIQDGTSTSGSASGTNYDLDLDFTQWSLGVTFKF